MNTNQYHELYTAQALSLPEEMYGPADDISNPLISLAYGFADPAHFPREDLLAISAAVLRDDINGALNYGQTFVGLREQVAIRLRREGIEADVDNILISYGSSQILALLPLLLVNPGDTVIIEGPSFLGAVRQFADAGAKFVTIAVDEHGMDVDALETTLRDLAANNVRPKFIYTIPTFHNPTGATLSLERRKKLVALAAEYRVIIVEDDAYRELRFEGEPVPSLAALDQEGWVVRLGTFSKTLAPGLRQGWGYAHPEIISKLQGLKLEGSSGPFLTRVVGRFASEGKLDAHIVELCEVYRHKRDVMLEAMAREFPADVRYTKPDGGFFLWCTLPERMTATELLKRTQERGATFLSGTRCYANGQGDNAIRLAFSYAPVEDINEGIARIGAAMKTF